MSELVSLQIGNMVTGSIKRNPTPLQICLGLLIKENKRLLKTYSQLGITCTHDEGLRFRVSAAIAGVKNAKFSGICNEKDGFIQSVAGNRDADINSPNSKLSTQAVVILLTQPELSKSTINTEKIRRISKLEMTEPIDFDIKTRRYQGPKNVYMSKCSKDSAKSLKQLALQQLTDSATINSKQTVPSLKQLAVQKLRN